MKRENLKEAQKVEERITRLEEEIQFISEMIEQGEGANLFIAPPRGNSSRSKVLSGEMQTEWVLRYFLAEKERRREELLAHLETL